MLDEDDMNTSTGLRDYWLLLIADLSGALAAAWAG